MDDSTFERIRTRMMSATISCLLVMFSFQLAGQVRLPGLIGDGMVLQRDVELKIWGWASAGEEVTISFNGSVYRSRADAEGEWEIRLPAMTAGGPFTMDIHATNHIRINDILVGDVWLCSGQSNMVLPMERVRYRYPDVVIAADNPAIRQLIVPKEYDFGSPQKDIRPSPWEPVNGETILRFSAVAYFFASELYERYRVPIGLINASVGGTPVEAWMSRDALKEFPHHLENATKFSDDNHVDQILAKEKALRDTWYQTICAMDNGLTGDTAWYEPRYDASAWPVMQMPGFWDDEKLVQSNGVVWFRKEIELSESMAGSTATLLLGRIVDWDSVYVNGVFVGTTTYQYPPRRYTIPENILRAGKNVIVVRIINNSGKGGFIKDKPYMLIAGNDTVDLKGEWRYRLGVAMKPLPPQTFIEYKPTGLFNGMIAPLVHYAIRGVIWYQGESNTSNPSEYQQLFPRLIGDWRQKWNAGEFPFLYVQLASFMEAKEEPSLKSQWAELREAQRKTLSVPNTGMAVTIDIGEWNDIHPLNKKDVGKRLASLAQTKAYGEMKIVDSGPMYSTMRISGNKIILSFTGTGSGLMVKGGGPLKHFTIAGSDRKFTWAEAKIKRNRVVVWKKGLNHPVAVRYAWADNPEGANLFNREGLPASPFSTEGQDE